MPRLSLKPSPSHHLLTYPTSYLIHLEKFPGRIMHIKYYTKYFEGYKKFVEHYFLDSINIFEGYINFQISTIEFSM